MKRAIFTAVLGCLLSCSGVALAGLSSEALEEEYGKGVHYYFSGNYAEAHKLFTAAIEAGITDPRPYYFRGLCCLNLGRQPDGRADFMKAAKLENSDSSQFYDVSRSLERVQGSSRAMLEGYRVEARVLAAKQREQMRAKRYESNRRAIAGGTPTGPAKPAAAPDGEPGAAPAEPGAAPTPPAPGATPANPAAPANPFAP